MCGFFRRASLRQSLPLILAVTLVGVTGCRSSTEITAPPGAHGIRMVVLTGRQGETLALVPIYIEDEGPFSFALDTGASRTVVDRRIAAKLGLPAVGDQVEINGVGGNALAQPMRVGRWRLADIELPASTVDALELCDFDRGVGLQGLLGSDTLSKFDIIHIDYKNQRLVFHTGPSGVITARRGREPDLAATWPGGGSGSSGE